MQRFSDSKIDYKILFYNPNIHPRSEYEIRKNENKRFAEQLKVEFVDCDYNRKDWFAEVLGLEWEPERGLRCSHCFDMRFVFSAKYAAHFGFQQFTSSLGISRWKDMEQINNCGRRAAANFPNLSYWSYNWRKGGGSSRMIEISKQENFYQQEYCGCVYSLRDTNSWRQTNNRAKIELGTKFYK